MPRQRPFASPTENPRAWWRYAVACVTSRPNSRPWPDVKSIGLCRRRYIELVAKKNADRSGGIGFHAGMSSKHSDELLVMEDALPIEALLAFHLVALRRVHESQQRPNTPRLSLNADLPFGTPTTKTRNPGRFRLLRSHGGSRKRSKEQQIIFPIEDPSASVVSSLGPSKCMFEDQSAFTTVSLLQAMTLRLGKKVWFVDWKLHDATICTILVGERDGAPMMQFVLRASGNLRSFGLGKRDFAFDVSQCDLTHEKDKILFVGSAETDKLSCDEKTNTSSDSCKGDTDRTIMTIPFSGTIRADGPDLSTPSTFLELPPKGTVCRVIAGKNQNTSKLSISAHPATLVWTSTLSDSIAEFFADQAAENHTDFASHIRSAATPLARKAQLALLSPASLAFHLNIEAPKVWIPLISNTSEGMLFLDAGTLRMSSSKEEGDTEIQWDVHARDIGANFVRGINSPRFRDDSYVYGRTQGVTPTGRGETSVVKPFSIDANSRILRDLTPVEDVPFADPIRSVEVIISSVCLNLVDAEMLARFLGKLYARGLHGVRRRELSESLTQRTKITPHDSDFRLAKDEFKRSDHPKIFTVKVEKIELALEGHSKNLSISDDRSMASIETLQDNAPPTRVYLVEIFQILLKKSCLGHTEITRLSVADASIFRLSDVSMYAPLNVRRDNLNSENCILVRAAVRTASDKRQDDSDSEKNQNCEVFRAALLHNQVAHLDEVEVDIDSVILRVTPTTLKDCAKAFRRIMELTQLVTKEMERKVHEEGRKARRRCK